MNSAKRFVLIPHASRKRFNRPMTERQKQVLAFVQSERRAGRPIPHGKIIADHFGWPCPNSGTEALRALARHGFVRSNPFQGINRKPIDWQYIAHDET